MKTFLSSTKYEIRLIGRILRMQYRKHAKQMPRYWFPVAVAAKLAVVVFLALHSTPTLADTPKESTFDHVMKTQTLRCGYAIWSPVLYRDMKTNELKGTAHDIVEEMGKRLGLKVEWAEETGFGNAIEGLVTNRYDMICTGLYLNAPRSKRIGFSSPYLYSPVIAVVRQDENRFTRNADLNSKAAKIAVIEGEAAGTAARQKFPEAQIDSLAPATELPQVYEEVHSKKADATLMEPATFMEYAAANPGALKILDKEPISTYPVAFGLPQGDIAFKTMIDAALSEVQNDGFADRAIERHQKFPGTFYPPSKPYEVPK